MDLHVFDPSGEEVYYGNLTSASGGKLDLDRIPRATSTTSTTRTSSGRSGQAPHGNYRVVVHYYDDCGVPNPIIVVTVQMAGQSPQTFSGSFVGLKTANPPKEVRPPTERRLSCLDRRPPAPPPTAAGAVERQSPRDPAAHGPTATRVDQGRTAASGAGAPALRLRAFPGSSATSGRRAGAPREKPRHPPPQLPSTTAGASAAGHTAARARCARWRSVAGASSSIRSTGIS